MPKLKLELARKTIAEKLTLGAAHIAAMTGNTHYPAASRIPTDAQLQAAQDELEAAASQLEATDIARRQQAAIRDAKEVAWDEAFTARASNCEALTPSDDAALASTGFPFRNPPAPLALLPTPTLLVAEDGPVSGTMQLRFKPVAGALTYEWQCRPQADPAGWTLVKTSTVARLIVPNLTTGVAYVFRVRATGRPGTTDWSAEVTRYAP